LHPDVIVGTDLKNVEYEKNLMQLYSMNNLS